MILTFCALDQYLFMDLLELVDFNLKPSLATGETCPCYHFYPRFVRDLPDNGKEVLAMTMVLRYLLENSGPLVNDQTLARMAEMGQYEWLDFVDDIKGMVVTSPGMKPCSVRVDQLDRNDLIGELCFLKKIILYKSKKNFRWQHSSRDRSLWHSASSIELRWQSRIPKSLARVR